MTTKWVLDATMGIRDGVACFCPLEGDINGEYTVITGLNVLTNKPNGEVVAIFHGDGQDALEQFIADNREFVDNLLSERSA